MICNDCKRDEPTITEVPVKVVVCGPDRMHYPLTFYSCCDNTAEEYAMDFVYKTFGEVVQVAEAWWPGDTMQTGPSSTWYPDNHIGHEVIAGVSVMVGAQQI